MDESLEIKTLKRVYGDMSNQDKRETLELLCESFNLSDIDKLQNFVKQKRDRILRAAENHLWNKELGVTVVVTEKFDAVICSGNLMRYNRGGTFQFHPVLDIPQSRKEKFKEVCKEFFENPEHPWNK